MGRLLELLQEAAEIRGIAERRRHLVSAVGRLIDATFVATVVSSDFRPGGRGQLSDVDAYGLDGTSTDVLTVLAQEGSSYHPALKRSMNQDDYREPLVWKRRERASDRVWFHDAYVNDYVVRRHLGDGIFGGARLPSGLLFGVGAMREEHDPDFGDEEAALLEGYAAGARRLWHERDRAAELGRTLPPRLRSLLSLMLSGKSEKEIAAELDLTWATVHTYARQLYRALGVGSRAQLMSRALK
jgi:DNA-binding CsgD family transcriptional regulator